MSEVHAAGVLLQWAAGGLLFLWVTTRRREVGPGYGWLLRSVFAALAAIAGAVGLIGGSYPLRDAAALAAAAAALGVGALSWRRRDASDGFPPNLDLLAPAVGLLGVVAEGVSVGGSLGLSLARVLIGSLFLGVVTDAMLLGHWYLVQPGLRRAPLVQLVRWSLGIWPLEVAVMLIPTGMASVLSGSVDDGFGGLLGWFWIPCSVLSGVLLTAAEASLKVKRYAAVMAATGLLYLAIMTAFGMDLLARISLRPG